jgi:hypothetical protein
VQGTSINYAEFDKLPGFFIQLFSSQKAAVRFSTSLPFTLKTIGISEKKILIRMHRNFLKNYFQVQPKVRVKTL